MNTVFQTSATTWCGAGMTGRSKLHETFTVLANPPPKASIFGSATTVFMKIAAIYQATRMITHTTVTGTTELRSPSVLIAMPRLQALTHPVGNLQELRRLADIQRAVCRQICFDHINDAARPRTHHHDL